MAQHLLPLMISLSKTLASFNDKEWEAMERATAKLRALATPPSKVKPQSGVVGVTWNPASSKWVTRAYINRKVKHVGTFFELEEAIEAQKDYYHKKAL